MIIEFHKYHGTGNDFVIVDQTKSFAGLDTAAIVSICDRHRGVGADGFILLKNTGEEEYKMDYFNSDGSTGALCGNGGRCAAALADFLTVRPADRFRFMASDGIHVAEILERHGNLSRVRFSLADVTGIRNTSAGLFLHTGSPHLVCISDGIENIDVEQEGRSLRYAPEFGPEGTNVNFASFEDGKIRVRTYERGVEKETLSCGTGVTAVALAHAKLSGQTEGPLEIITSGGILKVNFKRKKEDHYTGVSLEGPAVKVFSGYLELWNIRKKN